MIPQRISRALLAAMVIALLGLVSVSSPASGGAGQRTLFNHTGVQAKDKYFEPSLNQPASYRSPDNYVDGNVYMRLQVLDKPSNKEVIGQLCFWRHGSKKYQFETCSATSKARFSTEGTYYINLGTLGSFWKKNGTFDWSKPVSVGRFMLKDPVTNKLLLTSSCGAACYTKGDIDQHVPVKMHIEVVLVPKGSSLTPPTSWRSGCPKTWSSLCQSGGTTTTTPPPSTTGTVVLLTNTGKVASGDRPLYDAIRAAGHSVTVVAESAVTQSQATGAKAVVISSGVVPNEVPAFLSTAATPIVVSEAFVFDDLGMATSVGERTGQTRLQMGTAHPVSSGVSGTVTVSTSTSYNVGSPSGSAVVIARLAGSTQPTIFAYEKGAAMRSGSAPARRVGFFMSYQATTASNATGMKLFNQALAWAIG